jgi:uncharacterized protein YoxC
MKRRLTNARKSALRALHRNREQRTAARLSAALNRMEAGNPRILALPFKWTKANLAREAGVHITTILFKIPDGTYRYAALNARYETLREQVQQTDAKLNPGSESVEERLKAIKQLAQEREQELAAQAEEICQLRAKVSDLESRNLLLDDLQKKNAELRASYLEIQSRCQKLTAKRAERNGATDDF